MKHRVCKADELGLNFKLSPKKAVSCTDKQKIYPWSYNELGENNNIIM